jgi:maltose O-acetyltransferase
MPTEREKMVAGDLYNPLDPELVRARERARDLCQTLNKTRESQPLDLDRAYWLRRRYGLDAASVLLRLRYEHKSGNARFLQLQLHRTRRGADVWVGSGALILAGVRIGSRSVIGAGSVVTRDMPDDVFAAGNPCRVIREIAD